MANEITCLTHHGRQVTLLLLFPIAAPRTINGQNVVEKSASQIPQVGGRSAVTDVEASAINDGTLGWETFDLEINPELSTPQLVAQVRALYAARLAVFQDEYVQRWRFAGARVNVTA